MDVLVTVAASVVVVAALQNIVRARERLVLALTLTFGLLNGVAFGHEFVVAAPFAWSHAAVAALVFAGTVLVGELWLGALAWATRTWLDERGVPERVLAVLASAVIIHTAAHRLVERGQIVARAGTFGAERVLVAITLAWIAVMLAVAVANALSARGARRRGGNARGRRSGGVVTTRVVQSPSESKNSGRERAGVFALAGIIVTIVIVYFALSATGGRRDESRNLLPYQALAASLPESDQRQFRAIREQLLAAEALRARTFRWPDVSALALPGNGYTWTRFERGVITNYLGKPPDASQAGVDARDPGARARDAARPGAERRAAPSAARRHHAAHLRLDAPDRRRRRGRLRAPASEHRLDRDLLGRAQPGVCHQEMTEMTRLRASIVAMLASIAVLAPGAAASAQTPRDAQDRRHAASLLLVDEERRRHAARL